MPRITGTVTDIAGNRSTGKLRLKAPHVRQNSAGDAVIDERLHEYVIVDGEITGDAVIDPGPAMMELFVRGRVRSWIVSVPDGEEIDLWSLIESQAEYEPTVVSRVYADRLKAEAAALSAERTAAGIQDIAADAAQVAADRLVVESARTEVESDAATSTTAAATATEKAGEAQTARDVAVEAMTAAETARAEAESFQAVAGGAAVVATEQAEAAADAAEQAAGYVGSVLDGAITTPKLAEDAVTSSKLAPTVRSDLAGREQMASKGQANGYAPLDAGAKIPAAHLPSYVDDVVEFPTQAGFPATGETGKIYTALDTNRIYRWSGSAYVEISPSPGSTDAVPEGATNKYYTDARARAAVADDIAAKYTKPTAGIPATDLAVGRVVGAVNGAATSLTIWVGTEAQYTALGTKDPNTIYLRTA